MPAIADQVAALEHDHDDALAMIDTLTAANAALLDALNAVTAEKAALEAQLTELRLQADAMTAMVEKFANSALDMLKAARLPAGTPAEVIAYAPRPKTLATTAAPPSFGLADVLDTQMLKPAPAPAPAMPAAPVAREQLIPTPPEPRRSPIVEPVSAVELVKRRLLPVLTLTRRPVPLPAPAKPDPSPNGLPLFLRRDTVFARAAA
jgi:hypothetical protein